MYRYGRNNGGCTSFANANGCCGSRHLMRRRIYRPDGEWRRCLSLGGWPDRSFHYGDATCNDYVYRHCKRSGLYGDGNDHGCCPSAPDSHCDGRTGFAVSRSINNPDGDRWRYLSVEHRGIRGNGGRNAGGEYNLFRYRYRIWLSGNSSRDGDGQSIACAGCNG